MFGRGRDVKKKSTHTKLLPSKIKKFILPYLIHFTLTFGSLDNGLETVVEHVVRLRAPLAQVKGDEPFRFAHVTLHVPRKRSAVQEAAATRAALKGAATRVQAGVDGEVDLLREALVANGAQVGLEAQVSLVVLVQRLLAEVYLVGHDSKKRER